MRLIDKLTRYVDDLRRRQCRRALRDALTAFERCHLETRFDLPFLTGRGAAALEARDARALAQAWTSQFRYRDETRRGDDVRRLTLPAQTFLELLERAEAGYVGRLGGGRTRDTNVVIARGSAGTARLSEHARTFPKREHY